MASTESEPWPAATGAALIEHSARDGSNDGGRVQGDGQRLKEQVLTALQARYRTEIAQAQRAMVRLLLERGECTIDDVRAALDLSDTARTKWLGAAVGELQRAGIIRHAGYVASSRAVAHARPISRWALADTSAALSWLRDDAGLQAVPRDGGQGLLFGGAVP